MRTEFRSESPKGRDKLKDKNVNVMITLRWIWCGRERLSNRDRRWAFMNLVKKTLGFLKIEFLNQLDDCYLLKEDFILGSLTMKCQCH
jgi:hypothetical protein